MMWDVVILFVAVILIIILAPFVGYLWGKSQASGWIAAFKNSNLTTNKKDNGKTKNEKTEV